MEWTRGNEVGLTHAELEPQRVPEFDRGDSTVCGVRHRGRIQNVSKGSRRLGPPFCSGLSLSLFSLSPSLGLLTHSPSRDSFAWFSLALSFIPFTSLG